MPPALARPSVASLLIQALVNQQPLGTATGFLVQKGLVTYLVTNRHNVTGRHAETAETMHPSGGLPDSLVIWHNKIDGWVAKTEPLYGSDGEPLWLEHPALGSSADVVALPLRDTDGVRVATYDPWAPVAADMFAGDFVNIIGFPLGITASGLYAIWIKGGIASDPEVDFNGRPVFLVDARTRSGNSGSPVVGYYPTGMIPKAHGITMGRTLTEDFLGVYSGRIPQDPQRERESDLGIVWKARTVAEIIDGAGPAAGS